VAKRRPRGASPGIVLILKLLPGYSSTVLIKNSLQLISDVGGVTMLDVTALHHVDEFAVSE
jgi:hypothetical protein